MHGRITSSHRFRVLGVLVQGHFIHSLDRTDTLRMRKHCRLEILQEQMPKLCFPESRFEAKNCSHDDLISCIKKGYVAARAAQYRGEQLNDSPGQCGVCKAKEEAPMPS